MTRTVRDVALRTPLTVLPDVSICEAEQKLIAGGASEIYVIDADDMLCGVVPDYDLLNYRLLGGDGQGRIAALMSRVDFQLAPSASLESGARLLNQQQHSSIPVVEGGRLIGKLCRSSLLRILAAEGYEAADDLVSFPTPFPPAPKFALFSQSPQAIRLLAR